MDKHCHSCFAEQPNRYGHGIKAVKRLKKLLSCLNSCEKYPANNSLSNQFNCGKNDKILQTKQTSKAKRRASNYVSIYVPVVKYTDALGKQVFRPQPVEKGRAQEPFAGGGSKGEGRKTRSPQQVRTRSRGRGEGLVWK